MSWPLDRTAKRDAMLAAVAGIKPTLAEGLTAGEAERTLPTRSVEALRDAGLFAIKVPAALGGAEADPVSQMEVYEAVSRIDPAAGWATFIGNGAMTMTAYLSDEAIERMWAAGRTPTAAGVLMPGRATPVEGGYRVDGRWSWASGIRHAEWVGVNMLVDAASGPQPRWAMFPIGEVDIDDNWHVSGLKGTGSCDFSIRDRFVEECMTFSLQEMPIRRGGALYRLGPPGQQANELAGFALGVGRRALDEITAQALERSRGYGAGQSIAGRTTFQRELGEADLKLRAARALVFDAYEHAWDKLENGESIGPADQVDLRAATAYTMHAAHEVALTALRYGGGSAARLDNMLQRCVRDLQVGALHLFASDAIYEQAGRRLLGATDLNAMI